ncbi:MAG TPA: glycosyltransferase family 39 protein, partial [Chloroflexota bacterium]|nr:glycosyltransferase family 39 protein [Chloroflexota bacterium]
VAGLGLALVGQHLVAHRLDLWAGAGLLGLGAALFTLACWPASGGCEGATTAPPDSDGPASPGGLSRLSHFLTPTALNAFALVLFWRGVQPSLAWTAWAASLVAAGSVAWSLAGRPRPALWPTRELAAVLVLTALGAAFRLYRLDELPPGLWWDEAVGGLEALKILRQPDYRPIYAAGLVNSGYLWFYLSAAFVNWLGPTPQALRLAALVGGVLYVPVMYGLGRQLFGPRAALPAAAIAAVLLWNVNFSRNGWSYAWTLTSDALAITLLARALLLHRPGAALAAGLAWGIALHAYTASRLILPIALALVAIIALRERQRFLVRHAASLATCCLGIILAASPLLLDAWLRPADYAARPQQVFIWNEVQRAGRLDPLLDSLRQHVLMFNVAGDRNGRHNLPGAPMLDQVTAALFVLGLGLALTRLRQPAWLLVVLWCVVGLMGGALTLAFEAPQALRAIEAQTPAILFAAGALGVLPALARRARSDTGARWGTALVGILLASAVGLNYQAYFVLKATDFAAWAAYSTSEAIAAQRAEPLAASANVYLDDTWVDHPTVKFLAPDLKEPRRLDPLANVPLRDPRPAAVFLTGELTAPIDDLLGLYPDTWVEGYAPPFGGPTVARAAFIPTSDLEQARGLSATYTPLGGRPPTIGVLRSLELDWSALGGPIATSFDLEIAGVIAAPAFGRYQFAVEGPPGATLELDGMPVATAEAGGELTFARGNHQIRLTARFESPASLSVRWARPGEGQERAIPDDALFSAPLAWRGLLARYRRGTDWEAPVQFAQIDRYPQRRVHLLPLPRPYSVELSGRLYVERPGTYRFATDAIGRAWLWIDERLLANDIGGRSAEASVVLEQGFHQIRARFLDQDQFSRFDVLWTPPGGNPESIPTRVLYPPVGQLEESAASAPPPPRPPLPPFGEPTLRWAISAGAEPRGVAAAPDGTIYVADARGGQVNKLDSDGRRTLAWSHPDLAEPVDVAVGRDGRPWVLDSERGWLIRFEPDGTVSTRIAGPSVGLYRPRGVAIGTNGALYIAATGSNQVVKLSEDGLVLARYGPDTGGSEQLLQPTALAVDADGDMYVISGERHAAVRLDPAGRYRAHWTIPAADTIRSPHVAIGPDGAIYVSEPSQGRIARYGPSGQPAGVIELSGSAKGALRT